MHRMTSCAPRPLLSSDWAQALSDSSQWQRYTSLCLLQSAQPLWRLAASRRAQQTGMDPLFSFRLLRGLGRGFEGSSRGRTLGSGFPHLLARPSGNAGFLGVDVGVETLTRHYFFAMQRPAALHLAGLGHLEQGLNTGAFFISFYHRASLSCKP